MRGLRLRFGLDRVLEFLDKHSDKLKVPTMVVGFRIKDQARAKRELDEVHSLIRNLLDLLMVLKLLQAINPEDFLDHLVMEQVPLLSVNFNKVIWI